MPALGIFGMRLLDFIPSQAFKSTVVTFTQWQDAADFESMV